MYKIRTAVEILLAALAFASCGGDANLNVTGPTSIGLKTSDSASFALTPDVFTAQSISGGACPLLSPFLVGFNLSVHAGAIGVSVTDITFRFSDRRGVAMPQVTLPAPVLATQFGTTLVQARSARVFPLTFRLDCTVQPVGTLVVILDTLDANGRAGSVTLTGNLH
jgi:hypothetical protein